MNNDKLVSKREDLNSRAKQLVTQDEDLVKQINTLVTQREQIKRNFDAIQGALQLLDELSKDEAPTLELIDEKGN